MADSSRILGETLNIFWLSTAVITGELISLGPIMRQFFSILLIFIFVSTVQCQFNDSLTNWIISENVTARGRIFANIGSKGEFASDGDPGAVVASPSTAYPNYYFQIGGPVSILLTCTGFATLL